MSELITFEGRTVAVIAPEDLEELEAAVDRLRAEVEHWKAARKDALEGGDILKAAITRHREALWVLTEHNALHHGENHNTVILGRKTLMGAE